MAYWRWGAQVMKRWAIAAKWLRCGIWWIFYFIFFLRDRVCWQLLCLCRPFMIFEGCRIRSVAVPYQLSHPSPPPPPPFGEITAV